MKEKTGVGDAYAAGLIARPNIGFVLPAPFFTFDVVCYDRFGNIKWEDTFRNLVTDAGINSLLDVYFDGATQITAWYCGLKGTGDAAAGDTLASHSGWSEITDYTGDRKAITFGEPSSKSLAASSAVSFAINGTATVAGAFITSAETGASGTLYSAGNFTGGNRSVIDGDTLNVTPTVSGAAS